MEPRRGGGISRSFQHKKLLVPMEQSVAAEKENALCVPRTRIWPKWKERSRLSRLSFVPNVSKLFYRYVYIFHLPAPKSPTEVPAPRGSPTALRRPISNSLHLLGGGRLSEADSGMSLGDECGVHGQTASPEGARVQALTPIECTTNMECLRHLAY